MREALYIVGAPGAGKTTLSLALREGWLGLDSRRPIAHTLYPDAGVVSLGRDREGFGGTDALGMTAVVPASAWVMEPEGEWDADQLMAEGDRLAVGRFIDALDAGGWNITIAHLKTDPEVSARRRAERADRLGASLQGASWVQGRETKVLNLVERYAGITVTLNGNLPTEASVKQLADLSPVAHSLTRGLYGAPC